MGIEINGRYAIIPDMTPDLDIWNSLSAGELAIMLAKYGEDAIPHGIQDRHERIAAAREIVERGERGRQRLIEKATA